jgi:hypothetical protein
MSRMECRGDIERSRGIEPRPAAWRAAVQPFHLLRLLPAANWQPDFE